MSLRLANGVSRIPAGAAFETSAELAALVGDESGTGLVVFNNSPTLAGTVIFSGGTANTVPYLNGSKGLVSSAVTPTELGYLSGVTSAIQTQLNAKQGLLVDSAGLRAALSDETGSGAAVFGTSPTIATPSITGSLTLDSDAILVRDAANTLALRNGTAAQEFDVYGTYTSGTSYEKLRIRYNGTSSRFSIVTEKGSGGGNARTLALGSDGTENWGISSSGHFLALTDNTYDIGASGATRPRDGFFARNVVVGSQLQFGTGSFGKILSTSDGIHLLANAAVNDYNRLQLGGTSNLFPAIARETVYLGFKLADNSAYTSIKYNLRATPAVAGTIASSATIAPTAPITFISGTTTIDTITPPAPISSTGGRIILIPTGLWSTSTSGNIALASTAVVNKALIMAYDATTAKWYPSY